MLCGSSGYDCTLRRSHAELESKIQERIDALRSLLRKLLREQDDWRRRIARDLHDSWGQYLALLKISMGLVVDSK